MRYGSDPIEFYHALRTIFGQEGLDELAMRKQSILHKSDIDEKAIRRKLRAELDRLIEARAQGKTGRLDFDSPY